jgi:hypothetical protein
MASANRRAQLSADRCIDSDHDDYDEDDDEADDEGDDEDEHNVALIVIISGHAFTQNWATRTGQNCHPELGGSSRTAAGITKHSLMLYPA